jgi:tagatose-1,6-bisphosphate aldolase
MMQIKEINNSNHNTSVVSLELKNYLEQIAITKNLREQLINQIYIITDIQKAINNDTIKKQLSIFLSRYNDSIIQINGAIVSQVAKLKYFDIEEEELNYEKKQFTLKLASKCQEVERVFDQVAILNAKAIEDAKGYIQMQKNKTIDFSSNININNAILANNV